MMNVMKVTCGIKLVRDAFLAIAIRMVRSLELVMKQDFVIVEAETGLEDSFAASAYQGIIVSIEESK